MKKEKKNKKEVKKKRDASSDSECSNIPQQLDLLYALHVGSAGAKNL